MEQNWIESLKTLTEMSVLVRALGLTPQKEAEFWKELLTYLKSETEPVEEEDMTEGSLFEFIQKNADLKDGGEAENYISELYSQLKENIGDSDFWNKSLTSLISFFINNIEEINDETPILKIEGEGKSITVNDLREADAGYNFPISLREENEYVHPYYNIDGQSYDEVRKCDEVKPILENDKKLQYTHAPNNNDETLQVSNWIRLLMPQYGRRVEVEDLDRNFWVIAQVISAISNYLFDEDAPIPKTIEGLLRETSEIWENILYLWLGIAAMTQKKDNDVQVIVMPLPPRALEHNRKYDNLDFSDICSFEIGGDNFVKITQAQKFRSEVIERLKYLKDKYSESNLLIIPYIRLENYKHNYDAIEYYPCCLTTMQGEDTWKWYELYEERQKQKCPLCISVKYDGVDITARYRNRIFSFNEDERKLIYNYPYSSVGHTYSDKKRFSMYGALRTIVTVDAAAGDGKITVNNITFTVSDAFGDFGTTNQRILANLNKKEITSDTMTFEYKSRSAGIPDVEQEKLQWVMYTTDKSICYLGEVASYRQRTSNKGETTNLFEDVVHVIKVGSYLPNSQNGTFVTARMSDTKHTLMRGNITRNGATGTTLSFYLNNWETYIPSKDTLNSTSPDKCFSDNPTQKSCTEITESFLRVEGLKAVKLYLQKTNNLKSPCYVATAIGLTPWEGGNGDNYWDIGAICHLYHYIPAERSLDKKSTDGSYTTAYKATPVYSYGGVSGFIDGTNGDNSAGKIISCNLINMLDSFCDVWGMSNDAQVYESPGWRQFQIKAQISDDSEYCYLITINEGDEDEFSYYKVKFSETFYGEVNYFDNRWAQYNSKEDIFNVGAQVSHAPAVTINTDSYTQSPEIIGKGQIAKCTYRNIKIQDRPNTAKNANNTGFITPPTNFMSIQSGKTEDEAINNAIILTSGSWVYN